MNKKTEKIGEIYDMKCGQKAKLIAYRGVKDIDIEFEDGSVREGVKYYHFKKGNVSPTPREDSQQLHLNKEELMHCGEKAKIIAYRSSMDIDIQFEDGTIVNTQYGAFIRGMVQKDKKKHHDESRIGEQLKAKNGQIMTVVAYRTSNDMDIQFEDGTIVKHISYRRFKSGCVRNPSSPKYPTAKLERIGEKNRNNDGKWMEIVGYRSCVDIDVEFEDKKVREHVTYLSFTKGEIKHPDDSVLYRKRKNQEGGIPC